MAAGDILYRARCATCHEVEGGTGPELSAAVLEGYESSRRLHDYLAFAMPYEAPGSLDDEAYRAVVAWLLTDREVVDLVGPLGPEHDRPLGPPGDRP